jgi:hypothetical protein
LTLRTLLSNADDEKMSKRAVTVAILTSHENLI